MVCVLTCIFRELLKTPCHVAICCLLATWVQERCVPAEAGSNMASAIKLQADPEGPTCTAHRPRPRLTAGSWPAQSVLRVTPSTLQSWTTLSLCHRASEGLKR